MCSDLGCRNRGQTFAESASCRSARSCPSRAETLEEDGRVEMIPWDDVKEWFDPAHNGTLPDVVVPDTTVADWEPLFALIRSEGWRCEYDFREERLPLPASAAEVLVPDPEWVRSLWVWPNPDLEWIVRPRSW